MAATGALKNVEIPKATLFDSYHQLYGNLGQIGLFVLIILSAGQIVNERKKSQFTSLLNNGVNKIQFVLSKIVSQLLLFSLVYLLSLAFFGIYNFILFDKVFAAHSALSFALIFINFFFTIALVNFFSSFAKSTTAAMVLSFISILVLSLFNLFSFGKYLPTYLTSLAEDVLKGNHVTNAYQTLGITLALAFILSALAVQLCRNKE
jgi:ABC-2 type transport system permease protein